MKLISMTDFVIQQRSELMFKELGKACCKYADFLKQPLRLEMFVPCDENGNVLEIPKWGILTEPRILGKLNIQYQKAKEKVLFEGFEMHDNEVINDELERSFFIQDLEFFTIEELEIMSQKKPSLTPIAIKQIQP